MFFFRTHSQKLYGRVLALLLLLLLLWLLLFALEIFRECSSRIISSYSSKLDQRQHGLTERELRIRLNGFVSATGGAGGVGPRRPPKHSRLHYEIFIQQQQNMCLILCWG